MDGSAVTFPANAGRRIGSKEHPPAREVMCWDAGVVVCWDAGVVV